MNLPRERARLFELIRGTKAGGVVVLSGGRHLAELSVMDAGLGYSLYDLTSSGMNMANKRFRALEANRHRVATMDRGDNFGMVRIDWDREDPQVALEVHDADGDVTIRNKLPLSRLQPRAKRETAKGGNPDLAAEAKKHQGKEWAVEMVVAATGASAARGLVFLNSEKDFRSERNLTVVLHLKELEGELRAAKIADPRGHFAGKKIRVKGTVSDFRGAPQIEVRKLGQIEVVE
jgi:alkaline phosphatase D